MFCGIETIFCTVVNWLPPRGSVSASVMTPVLAFALTTVVYQPGYQKDVPCRSPVINIMSPTEKFLALAAVVVVTIVALEIHSLAKSR
jgi:hypothetical protein